MKMFFDSGLNKIKMHLKERITSPRTPRYYDIQKPVTLICDASQYGLGVACLQQNAPIAYASRTLMQPRHDMLKLRKSFSQYYLHVLNDFVISYKKGKHMYLADTLLHAP